jgi:thiamine monophosphate kinase
MKLSEIGEFGLIEKLARHAGAGNSRLICGIGDDCAVAESGRQGTPC